MITTLKTTAYPVENIPFPTVTICGAGLHMDNVEKAVAEDFAKWREKNARNRIDREEISEDMDKYMEEVFQINNTGSPEAANILDILNTMIASNIDASVGLNGVRENQIACGAVEDKHVPAPNNNKREVKRPVEEFCCEKMSLTLDQKSVENLGIGGKLEWHRKWGGEYTYNDGLGVYRNFIYRYIKLKKEGDNMTFESWCQFNSYGSDCSDEGSYGWFHGKSIGEKQSLFLGVLRLDQLQSFCQSEKK